LKKKIANGIELLLLLVSYIIMIVPCITMVITTSKEFTYEATMSAMDIIGSFPVLKIPMYALFLLCAVMCIVSILSKKEHRDGRIHSILAIILFLYVNYCIISCSAVYGETVSNKFPTGIFELCLFAVIVVSFVKRSTLITGLPEVKVVGDTTSAADELKKFKDLLDNGIITQEEFDAKKKQLLGL